MSEHNNDLSDLGATPNDLSDLGGKPIDNKAPTSLPPEMMGGGGVPEEFQDKTGAGDAGVAGLIQGGTLGFSDEMGAASDVALDKILGKAGKSYREYQKMREAANKEIQEEHPLAYGAGELVGGGLTMAIPVGGEVLGGAKLTKNLATVAPKFAAFLAGKSPQAMKIAEMVESGKITAQAAEKMLEAAPKVGAMAKVAGAGTKMAIEGAPAGALIGAGTSEHTLDNPSDAVELAKDTATGAGMGSLFGFGVGAGFEGGKQGINWAGKKIGKLPLAQKLGQQFELGTKNIDPYTDEGRALQLTIANKQIPQAETKRILDTSDFLGENIQAAKAQAIKDNIPINVDEQLKATADTVAKRFIEHPLLTNLLEPKVKDVLVKISRGETGPLSTQEAFALKDNLKLLDNKLAGASGELAGFARGETKGLLQALDTTIKTEIPAYKQAADKYTMFHQLVSETYLNPGEKIAGQVNKFSDLGNAAEKNNKLSAFIRSTLGGAKIGGGGTSEMAAVTLRDLQKRLSYLAKKDPATFAKYSGGKSLEETLQRLQNDSFKAGSIHQGQGSNPHEGIGKTLKGSVLGSGPGFAMNMANKAGAVTQDIKNAGKAIASAPAELGAKVFGYSPQQLSQLSAKLKAMPGASHLGEALENALARKDDIARKAILFKLMQNPEYRTMLRDTEGQQQEAPNE